MRTLQGTSIFLVGMMGSGKSTVGRMLANVLKYMFFDSDNVIEQAGKKSVSEIFAESGEEGFRDLETEVLRELSAYHNIVVATGGGAVVRCDNSKVSILQCYCRLCKRNMHCQLRALKLTLTLATSDDGTSPYVGCIVSNSVQWLLSFVEMAPWKGHDQSLLAVPFFFPSTLSLCMHHVPRLQRLNVKLSMCRPDNWGSMQAGVTVYLHGKPELLAKRVMAEDGGASRPLLSGTDGAKSPGKQNVHNEAREPEQIFAKASAGGGAAAGGDDATSTASASTAVDAEAAASDATSSSSESASGNGADAAPPSTSDAGAASEVETVEKLRKILEDREKLYKAADCQVGLHGERELGATAPEVRKCCNFTCSWFIHASLPTDVALRSVP